MEEEEEKARRSGERRGEVEDEGRKLYKHVA